MARKKPKLSRKIKRADGWKSSAVREAAKRHRAIAEFQQQQSDEARELFRPFFEKVIREALGEGFEKTAPTIIFAQSSPQISPLKDLMK